MKLTPWFPPDTKPVRPGIYMVEARNLYWRYWNGERWHLGVGVALEVPAPRHASKWDIAPNQNVAWRGCAEEQPCQNS
jgi:hypothetical protein